MPPENVGKHLLKKLNIISLENNLGKHNCVQIRYEVLILADL